ncbi:permease for cytosine/purines, uracil, thiamine, allantoin-domain-containing protein [Exophiala viscosa]|uniref:Permease for cytosine/purines, uracil, thiamine, allantoin-domain-containing protein n=1 Tax=Exophiala viscosa TaxID=2486360 RepID=A0AAN6I9K0_9EURO|nr:permease for cytosine/purines, uracil, thiamine, allantoin-domain-containing protein [Exophiala viscosa]
MGRRETFWGIPLPNLQQWKENFITVKNTKGFKNKLHVSHEMVKLDTDGSIFANGTSWANKDLDPVPPEQRKWRAWDFMTYWASDQFTIATWEFGSSMVAQGFTLREIVPLTFCGMFLTGVVCGLSGHVATTYRIGFPLSARLSWGMRFGWFPVLLRSFIALMWLGILNVSLAQCFHQMIRAVWPSFDDIPNALPADAGITSADLLYYFILLMIQTPLTLIPIYKLYYSTIRLLWDDDLGHGNESAKAWARVKAFGYAIISASVFWGLNFVFSPSYSLSGPAVHPDDVVDWVTRNRIGDLDEDSVDGTVVDTPEKVAEFPPKHQIAVSLPEQEKQV